MSSCCGLAQQANAGRPPGAHQARSGCSSNPSESRNFGNPPSVGTATPAPKHRDTTLAGRTGRVGPLPFTLSHLNNSGISDSGLQAPGAPKSCKGPLLQWLQQCCAAFCCSTTVHTTHYHRATLRRSAWLYAPPRGQPSLQRATQPVRPAAAQGEHKKGAGAARTQLPRPQLWTLAATAGQQRPRPCVGRHASPGCSTMLLTLCPSPRATGDEEKAPGGAGGASFGRPAGRRGTVAAVLAVKCAGVSLLVLAPLCGFAKLGV